ncbi:N-acetylmuramic acid 6-phosphate etherase [Bacillus thuringiensis]|uniref:N-acetylmuramic acid 6-phosphate etherase n=2 Tax=Bacillus thuringiensis TaxID=1428 RepID=A0A9W3NX75_BACTU|nr:N-acetylmuramic acid 6-phosphate etherase [Bacillus thuringiensis]AFQ15649.1 N-acetylmuramic acid-6-phosphate etherase [Bacillus thuringiensis HD-771]MEB4892964.1 N-acetylmuramic acid 6-phosphate etherase [Bacillus thuringiensis]MEC2473204.1 N-acetylmuramic acid 6-phosphate etherase [Bacillus thuringiensis]MEC2564676.1 N-acetylmuramic acid 6-phosphate etherase [Bacillus thuringiensis]MEC2641711.1 N-acetylmuramic acid 6-phosphate etherase [Bacillus thuringiensis]
MLKHLTTEIRNEKTMNLDEMSTIQFLKIMNEEDTKVADNVRSELSQIAKAVDAIVEAKRKGGRLIYIGAGTSGRIGLLDAVECPPTFGTASEEVVGLIAGGKEAFIKAVEGAEDSKELGVQDLKDINLTDKDILVGIAASGRTPYVIGGLEYANSIGVQTVAVSCNKESEIGKKASIAIEVNNGPEVLTGSTRLKSGTAQKLICNMLSTASMVRLGKVYGNLMVDVQLTNEKLVERAKSIVMEATSSDYETAEVFLKKADNNPKIAIVMILTGFSKEEAMQRLEETQGFIRQAIK